MIFHKDQAQHWPLPHEDNAFLSYQIIGDTNDPVLLLLHGGLGHMAELNSLVPHLAQNHCLIGIDLRGHGHSSLGSMALSYAQYQSDILALLDHLQINQFALLGFSDGGITGYGIAATQPSRVTRLITIGAQWRLEADDASREMLESLSVEDWQAMFPESVSSYQQQNPQPNFALLLAQVKALWLDGAGYPKQSIREIQCPTLLIRGQADPLLSMQEWMALGEMITDAQLCHIPFTGHDCHNEWPEIIGPICQRFLTSPSSTFENALESHD
ncbi:2-succinyl-6-hydroxy-2, 4-cyclohexadiene-1-carboxylate synthase [Vibrio stylophorae]|uniref:2-succinyl-6-hydroxy-2, 4-cyclohexadiene-1-carboxylate synthase n=1 Tax=Vibrio stylophorae TaxID=659351 RepID=A0ABN8DSZ8_9VIBR|nr:alpha/beta hydrolase [Vibrio stylophorae]CAH0533040.1 2-succinyl-6-hydroxy-2, 4-cyclohexadiene-1-carboxylate synthase [Vibrio stylophorae]